ncbi:MAG: alpha/beta fold hydrolase [Gammaproteobacteria bacterium]
MKDRHFEMIETNGVTLRTVVEGGGPLVVLLHGFPQCWYLWRHQIDPIVAAGYRVAVPDQRGYGASSCPPAVEDYDIRALTADVAGLARALGHDDCIVIGHDWGCLVAWNTALLHPQVCRAVMGLAVPMWRASPAVIDPPGMDDRFWYIRYFQQPGVAEAELEANLERALKNIYVAISADSPRGTFMRQLEHPASSGALDVFPEVDTLPAWLTRADLDYYLAQYRQSGFRGPINWYRNFMRNADITPENARFTQPAAFVAGAEDDVLLFDPGWRERFPKAFDDLRFIELIEGAGHWVQLEKPAETTAQILRFLAEVDG